MDKYHVIYGLNKRMASIINLSTSEVLNISLYSDVNISLYSDIGTLEKNPNNYVVIGSSLSKYSPCNICIGNNYNIAYITVELNEDKDDFEISIVCVTDDLMMDIKIRDDYNIGFTEEYTYAKMISEFKNNGRCRSNEDPVLVLAHQSNYDSNSSGFREVTVNDMNLSEECMNDEVRD